MLFTRELEDTEGFDMGRLMKVDVNNTGELMKSVEKEIRKEKSFEKR